MDFNIHYWRTKHGLEVDFILGSGEVAIEVKTGDQFGGGKLDGLLAFCEEHNPKKAYVVSASALRPRKISDAITLLPYQNFLEQLWQGQIIG